MRLRSNWQSVCSELLFAQISLLLSLSAALWVLFSLLHIEHFDQVVVGELHFWNGGKVENHITDIRTWALERGRFSYDSGKTICSSARNNILLVPPAKSSRSVVKIEMHDGSLALSLFQHQESFGSSAMPSGGVRFLSELSSGSHWYVTNAVWALLSHVRCKRSKHSIN